MSESYNYSNILILLEKKALLLQLFLEMDD